MHTRERGSGSKQIRSEPKQDAGLSVVQAGHLLSWIQSSSTGHCVFRAQSTIRQGTGVHKVYSEPKKGAAVVCI